MSNIIWYIKDKKPESLFGYSTLNMYFRIYVIVTPVFQFHHLLLCGILNIVSAHKILETLK